MTRIGKNLKLTIDAAYRSRVQSVFTEVLGAVAVTPPGQDKLEVYKLDGCQVGVFYVAPGEALSVEDQQKGAWLEFDVADIDATTKALTALGLTRITYADKEHAYFQLPGGPVFRLGKS
jgi:hypothetical protein